MVKNVRQQPDKESAQVLFERLESCRNQDNNPDSAAYKRKIEEMVDEDDLIGEDHIPIKQPKLDGVKVLSPGGGWTSSRRIFIVFRNPKTATVVFFESLK